MLRDLPQVNDPNLLVGYSKAADAAIYKIRDDLCLIQTVDFFTPIVDDEYTFGQIAAANSLSDCYAMGGTPLTALNVAAFPSKQLEPERIGKILRGSMDKCIEASCTVVGGHTVDSQELYFGLSVTGTAHPDRIVTNEAAKPGQALVLSKGLGTGIVTTASKLKKLPKADGEKILAATIASMAQLNRKACELMLEAGSRAATDITGFGMTGHAMELADASQVSIRLDARACPMLPGAVALAEAKVLTGADLRNRVYCGNQVQARGTVHVGIERVLFDAQTSGGLLIAVAPEQADALVEKLRATGHEYAARVGEVLPRGDASVWVDY